MSALVAMGQLVSRWQMRSRTLKLTSMKPGEQSTIASITNLDPRFYELGFIVNAPIRYIAIGPGGLLILEVMCATYIVRSEDMEGVYVHRKGE